MKAIKIVIVLAALGIISLLLTTKTQAQTRANLTSVVDIVIENAKSSSLNSRAVNWDSIKNEMHFTAQNAKSVAELRPAFETLLVALKDKHGKFFDPTSNTTLAQYPFHRGHVDVSSSELTAVKQAEFLYQNIGENIHYLRLTSTLSENDTQK